MKKLTLILALLVAMVTTTVAQTVVTAINPDNSYTLECKATGHPTRFLGVTETGVINGWSIVGSKIKFEAAENAENSYYIKIGDKYLNHNGTNISASTEKLTAWTLGVGGKDNVANVVTFTIGSDKYLNNNDSDGSGCVDGTCVNLKANYHNGGPASGNACSLWEMREYGPDYNENEISANQNLIQAWTSTETAGTYGPWGTEVITNYPSGITPSSGKEVHIATTNVTISELGRLNFTFQWLSGDKRLDILGVDLCDADGSVIDFDYHNGQTGTGNSNNIYTFVAPAGTYTLRYFVEHSTNGNCDLRRTNGRITGTLTNVEATKAAIQAEFESFANTGMFTANDISESVTAIQDATATTFDEFKLLETTHFIYFYSTLNNKCFTFNSKGRETTNGHYLGVEGVNLDGTMDIYATSSNELKNIWKLEYVDGKNFRLKNIAYDVYAKPIASYANNKTIQTTSSQEDAGQYLIVAQGDKIAIGDRADITQQYFFHEGGSRNIVRWSATAASPPSLWTAMEVEEPELCSITYNNIYEGNNLQTEKLNVKKNEEYTFVNNYTPKVGLRLKDTTPIPAAEVITEDKVVTYEYENILPFEAATVTNENRLATGSKLYKIKLHSKDVQLNEDGTGFEVNKNDAAIENRLFAITGSVFDNFQMFNYGAGLNKPIWAANDNSDTPFVPTAGSTGKLEIVKYGEIWSFKKSGTNAYLNDYGNNNKFVVWNSSAGNEATGSALEFTEATDKEISIATLNLDIKAATPYLSEDLLDTTIKATLQSTVNEANTALADENSTAEQLNEIDARLYQLVKDAANDLVVSNANGFKNNGVYTFVTARGWMGAIESSSNVISTARTNVTPEASADNTYFQWTVHKSVNTGKYYLYNIGKSMFMGVQAENNTSIPFAETPQGTNLTFKNSNSATHPIMFSTNNSGVANHSRDYGEGLVTWTGGWTNLNDEGSNHVVTKVGFINEETLANITNLVDVYESHINKPDLLAKITELTAFKESVFLTDEEKATIQATIDEAQAVYDNPKYSTVAAEITRLNELDLIKQLKYIWDISKLDNKYCYAIQTEALGSWIAEDGEDGTRLNSTTKLNTTHDATDQNQQFAFIKSANTGNCYLYSIGKGKFVKKYNVYTLLTESPEQTVSFLNGTRSDEYPWVIALNTADGQKQLCVSSGYTPGVVTNWNDTADPGNTVRIEIAGTFNSIDALAKISTYEINAIKAELLEKIGEANEYSAKTYLPEDKRAGLSTAAATAQGVYDDANATYNAFVEQIEIIENLLNHCVYVTSPEGFSNNAIYTIVAKYNNGNAYVMWDANQGDNGNYAISSSKNFGTTIETGENIPGCQWALYTSTSGKHYLYNIGAGKFMGTSNEGNGYIPLNDKPTSADLILKNSANDEYPIMFSVNNGAGVLNHNNGNSFPYGLLNWHSTTGWNDTSSASNIHKVTVVGALAEETLATIEDLVEAFETVGIKQLELKTLLDNIYAGYYDAWANNEAGAWRINPGLNNYSQPEGDEDFVEAYNEARTYETSEDIAAIEAQIARMNALVENLTINQPESGKYYRIRCTLGQKYLSSNTNDAGRLQMTESKDASNIFYYTNSGLLSYAKGVYIHAASESNHIKLRDIEQTSIATFIDGKDNNISGSYLINIKNSTDNGGGRYIHGKNATSDSGSTKPSNEQEGYNWWLEEVTSLPVTITAAGYATFYAPVAVEIPENIEAYYLKEIIGSFASMAKIESGVIPANNGVILTGEGGNIATEGTYNFDITNNVDAISNLLTGTVAAAYIQEGDYVLYNGKNGVGLYPVNANQASYSHKAYLPKSPDAQNSAGFRFSFGDDITTAIEKVESRNEKEEIYDLTGRKLEGISGAGIYIIDGKKVMVK